MSIKDYVVFKNITIDEFVHPEEAERKCILEKSVTQSVFNTLNEVCLSIMRPFVEGIYVKVTAEGMPELYKVLSEVCNILDYQGGCPQICISHNTVPHMNLCGDEKNIYIVISEYLLKCHDVDMIRFHMGNAITMLLAGHVKYATIAGFVPSLGIFDIIKKPFTDFLHAADATSDRGGLLACQSFAAAARCLFFEVGMPVRETYRLFKTDREAVRYVDQYLETYKNTQSNYVNLETGLAKTWNDITYIEGSGNSMLNDLYNWYVSPTGYSAVLNKYRSKNKYLRGESV